MNTHDEPTDAGQMEKIDDGTDKPEPRWRAMLDAATQEPRLKKGRGLGKGEDRRTVRWSVSLTPTEFEELSPYMLETDTVSSFATRCVLRAVRGGLMGQPLVREGGDAA